MSSTSQSSIIPRNHPGASSPREEARDGGGLQAENCRQQQYQELPVMPSPRRQVSGNLTPRLHKPTLSDMWSPRTTVIHDVSEDEFSGGDEDHDEDDAEVAARVEDQQIQQEEEIVPDSIAGNEGEQLQEDRVPFEAANERKLEVSNSQNSSSSAEPLPVSMHVPYKGSLSSESVGDKSTVVQGAGAGCEPVQRPDWSGTNTDQRQSRSVASIPESPPGVGGSRESFEGAQKPTASDLVVLAQEVQRLEIELELSRNEVKTLKENEAKSSSNQTPVPKCEEPSLATSAVQASNRASNVQRMDFFNCRIQGSEYASEPSHLQARLLKAERCVEVEREKASRLQLKYKIETDLIVEGQKALKDMNKVRKELDTAKQKNEGLEKSLEEEKSNVHAVKKELSKLMSASTIQSEDQQRLQEALEESMKEARQARMELSELRDQYRQASGCVEDATSRAESLHKQCLMATTELSTLKQENEELKKENTRLNVTVENQKVKIQRLLETPLHPPVHAGDAQHSSLPDPPSSEPVTDASRALSGDHNMELLVLAQEVERLEKELAIAKSNRLESPGEGRKSPERENKVQELSDAHSTRRPSSVEERIDEARSLPSNQSPPEVTVVAPMKEPSRQGGWGRGLWGFLAGSDLAQD